MSILQIGKFITFAARKRTVSFISLNDSRLGSQIFQTTMINIVLFGPPGAGKGIQAGKISETYGMRHLSTGEVIRAEIASGSPLGKEMEGYISRGELAPDSLVISMVEDYLRNNKGIKGVVFDGFPRTVAQAESFDKMLERLGEKVDVMLALQVPDDEAVNRILLRGKRDGRADDMSEDTIRNRLAIYKGITATVANYYDSQSKYVPVEGVGSVEEIFGRLAAEIDKHI